MTHDFVLNFLCDFGVDHFNQGHINLFKLVEIRKAPALEAPNGNILELIYPPLSHVRNFYFVNADQNFGVILNKKK